MTEYKKAWDEFIASAEGIDCADPVTIGASPTNRTYLESRLKRAFDAGWKASETAQGKESEHE